MKAKSTTREKSKQKRLLENTTPIPDGFSENDVVLGRGARSNLSRKGGLYRTLIDSYWQEYHNLKRIHMGPSQRNFVLTNIVGPIQEQGGRFLRWKNARWEEVHDEKDIIQVIMQALRDRRRFKEGYSKTMKAKNVEKKAGQTTSEQMEELPKLPDDLTLPDYVRNSSKLSIGGRSMTSGYSEEFLDSSTSCDQPFEIEDDGQKPPSKLSKARLFESSSTLEEYIKSLGPKLLELENLTAQLEEENASLRKTLDEIDPFNAESTYSLTNFINDWVNPIEEVY